MFKERNHILDALKFFAIFMVLLGHAVQYFLSSVPSEEPLYRFIYSFHMPLFMALSGYFSLSLLQLPFREMLLRKGRQLLLPAITFGFLLGLYITFYAGIKHGVFIFLTSFWFLKSAFVCCVLYYISCQWIRNARAGLLFSLPLSQLITPFQVWLMYPCFVLGTLLSRHSEWVKENTTLRSILFSGVVFFTLLLFWDAGFWQQDNHFLVFSPPYIDITGAMEFGYKRLYKIVIGLAGTIFFFVLFQYFSIRLSFGKIGMIFCRFGQSTLGIYLLQSFIVELFLARCLNFDNMSPLLFNFVVAPLISAAVLCVCAGIVALIRKSPICAYLLLGRKRAEPCK